MVSAERQRERERERESGERGGGGGGGRRSIFLNCSQGARRGRGVHGRFIC